MSKSPRASVGARMGSTPAPSASRATDNGVFGIERASQQVEELRLREIMPNRLQPRTQPKPEGLHELAASIREHGVIEPIIVRKIDLTDWEGAGRRYELVAGERRWRASALAEKQTIPALILSGKPDDRAMLELAITENLQREDLHPLDEALAFGQMQTLFDYSYAQIGERLGKSKGYVQNRLRLLQLDEDMQQLVVERPDTLTHVVELAKVRDLAARAALIAEVRASNISYMGLRAKVQLLLAPPLLKDEPVSSNPASYLRKYDSATPDEVRTSANDVLNKQSDGRSYDVAASPRDELLSSNPESYLRKYDSAPPGDLLTPINDVLNEQSYLQTYDSEVMGTEQASVYSAPVDTAVPIATDATPTNAFLSQQERTSITGLTAKVEHLLNDTTPLTPADWELLTPLALRLSELLRKFGQAREQ